MKNLTGDPRQRVADLLDEAERVDDPEFFATHLASFNSYVRLKRYFGIYRP